MSQIPRTSPLCGSISNARPLNEGDKCMNKSTRQFDYRNGKLYLCDYHAGCLGATIAEKEAELANSPVDFQTAALALIQQLQHMQQAWCNNQGKG